MADGQRSIKKVICLAYNMGDAWRPWDEVVVSEALLNSEETPKDQLIGLIPLEDSIFDPDKSAFVWATPSSDGSQVRCKQFAEGIDLEIARIERLANQAFADGMGHPTHNRVSNLLADARNAIEKFKFACDYFMMVQSRSLETATAIRQGFLIGRWLAQAEGLCAASEGMKFVAPKVAGRKEQRFWPFVANASQFNGMTEAEVFEALANMPDPDCPGTFMRVEESILNRGSGQTLKETSFCSRLRSLRADAKRGAK